jgi:hypothetical protein
LTTDLVRLQSLSIIDHLSVNSDGLDDPDAESFEDLDNDTENPNPSGPDAKIGAADSDGFVSPPEHRPLNLPSHNLINNHPHRKVELSLRIKQATRYLSAVREAVAEKSFQYSHVMRGTHSKGIRTRSRAVIGKASDRISHYCRVYTRARAAMVRLGADERTLNTFQVLSREDVKASTAILNPNTMGSSAIKLSWIWEIKAKTAGSTPDAMRECRSDCRVGDTVFYSLCLSSACSLDSGPSAEE